MSTFAWTIFLPCCCDHCEQIKTVTPETHGTFIDLVVFVFGGRGAGKQRQHSRSDGLSARQAGCHAASLQGPISLATPGSGRAAEKTGGWRWGRPGSCCQGGAERGTLAQASCQLKVITTAPTISSNRRGWTAHSSLPRPAQSLRTLGHPGLARTHVHSPRPALLAGREAGLEMSSAAGARQPGASGQTLVFRFKFQKAQKQPSSAGLRENPRQGSPFESQMGGWHSSHSIGNRGPRGCPERPEERAWRPGLDSGK